MSGILLNTILLQPFFKRSGVKTNKNERNLSTTLNNLYLIPTAKAFSPPDLFLLMTLLS